MEKPIYHSALFVTKLMKINFVMMIYSLPIITIPMAWGIAIDLIAHEQEGSLWQLFGQKSRHWIRHAKTLWLVSWLVILAWILLLQTQGELSWYYRLFMTSFYLNILHNLLQLHARTSLSLSQKIRGSISLFIRYLPRQFLVMTLLLLALYFTVTNLILTLLILPALFLWLLYISQYDIWRSLEEQWAKQGSH